MPQISDRKQKICQLNRDCERIKKLIKIRRAELEALPLTLDDQTNRHKTLKERSLRDLLLISKILKRKLKDVWSSQYFYEQERYCYLANL